MIRAFTLATLAVGLIATGVHAQGTATQGTTGRGTAGQVTTGQATTGRGTAGQATTGQATTGRGTTGQATTGQATTGQATTGQATTGRGTAGQGTAAKSAVNDSLFAMAAAEGGLAEVTLAELGVTRATDPELKKFSQQMVDEHTRMNSELTVLASRKGLALPRTLTAGHQFCAQSLAGLSGEEFDRCYAKAQLVIHMDSVAMFEAEAERGQDSEMKSLASKSLSHIKEHLATIKPIAMKYEKEKEKSGSNQ